MGADEVGLQTHMIMRQSHMHIFRECYSLLMCPCLMKLNQYL